MNKQTPDEKTHHKDHDDFVILMSSDELIQDKINQIEKQDKIDEEPKDFIHPYDRWRIPIQSATIDCFKHNTSPHRKIPHAGIYNQAPCVVGDLTA
jgi:hypothetical protein